MQMTYLCELLIAVGTSVNVGYFLDVLDQESMPTVPTNHVYGFSS